MRSDELFTEMKLVIEQFAQPLTTLTIVSLSHIFTLNFLTIDCPGFCFRI